jgi:hypothetical protein
MIPDSDHKEKNLDIFLFIMSKHINELLSHIKPNKLHSRRRKKKNVETHLIRVWFSECNLFSRKKFICTEYETKTIEREHSKETFLCILLFYDINNNK